MQNIAEKQQNAYTALKDTLKLENRMQTPRLQKVVISTGVGKIADPKKIELIQDRLARITGQKAAARGAKKSIASFKMRQGDVVGYQVTLRGARMRDFLDKLINVALPRMRDFRGLSPKQFDGRGNYTFGLTEQVMFHEIDQDKIDRSRGMDITIVTTATNDDQGRALLKQLGFPFAER